MIYQASYISFCILLAAINWKLIEANKRIIHGLNGFLHAACWVAIFLISKNFVLIITLPFIARLGFDTMLNKFRGLPFGYVSPWAKQGNPRSSIIDRLEWKIFKSGVTPKIIYLAIIVILNFFI